MPQSTLTSHVEAIAEYGQQQSKSLWARFSRWGFSFVIQPENQSPFIADLMAVCMRFPDFALIRMRQRLLSQKPILDSGPNIEYRKGNLSLVARNTMAMTNLYRGGGAYYGTAGLIHITILQVNRHAKYNGWDSDHLRAVVAATISGSGGVYSAFAENMLVAKQERIQERLPTYWEAFKRLYRQNGIGGFLRTACLTGPRDFLQLIITLSLYRPMYQQLYQFRHGTVPQNDDPTSWPDAIAASATNGAVNSAFTTIIDVPANAMRLNPEIEGAVEAVRHVIQQNGVMGLFGPSPRAAALALGCRAAQLSFAALVYNDVRKDIQPTAAELRESLAERKHLWSPCLQFALGLTAYWRTYIRFNPTPPHLSRPYLRLYSHGVGMYAAIATSALLQSEGHPPQADALSGFIGAALTSIGMAEKIPPTKTYASILAPFACQWFRMTALLSMPKIINRQIQARTGQGHLPQAIAAGSLATAALTFSVSTPGHAKQYIPTISAANARGFFANPEWVRAVCRRGGAAGLAAGAASAVIHTIGSMYFPEGYTRPTHNPSSGPPKSL